MKNKSHFNEKLNNFRNIVGSIRDIVEIIACVYAFIIIFYPNFLYDLVDKLTENALSAIQMLIDAKKLLIVIIGIKVIGLLIDYICSEISKYKDSEKSKELSKKKDLSPRTIGILVAVFMFLALDLFEDNNHQMELNMSNPEVSDMSHDNETVAPEPEMPYKHEYTESEMPQKLDIEKRNDVSSLTEEEKRVDYYINMGANEIIPIEILESLSDNELYYIRNGICAYSGRIYTSGYYNKYSWYKGTIDAETFDCSVLTNIQYENVINIRYIEDNRMAAVRE